LLKACLLILFGFDALWLRLVVPRFYKSQIGHLMAVTVNLPVAGFFYLLFVGRMVFFVVAPGVSRGETRSVILRGALFGLVTYGT
jgi:uncharacterized membrane protein